jgi:diguanylate cyclase (GGDEF)-like protein
LRLAQAGRWFTEIGNDPDLAVSQAINLHRQVPLLYGLLLINSLAVAITHRSFAPAMLTLSLPGALFTITVVRMIHWIREARAGKPSHEKARRQLRKTTLVAGPISLAYTAWSLALMPYGGPFEQAHVGLYVSTTVIGCIFCLIVLPQAAVVVTVAVFPAFIVMCFVRQHIIFVTIGINVTLVVGVLLRVMFNSFEHFQQEVLSGRILAAQHAELQRLNHDNQTLALTDSLTSLPNRRKFYADLEEFTSQQEAFAVGILDLDRFKPINDTYGHQVGDRLLTAVAMRLRETATPVARVYRLGGDEFGLIDFDVSGFENAAERLLQQIRAPLHIDEIVINVGGSMGIAFYPAAGTTTSDLFDRADYALYHAKHMNNGGLCLFSASLETAVRADRAIEAALQASQFEDELRIVLQPIVELSSGRLGAVEVLARWNSPLVGEVCPADFIAIAERSTVIHSITQVVIRKGLQAAKLLPENVAVSFNISACDLSSPTTLAFIRREIETAGIDAKRIWIEITETAVMRNPDIAAGALQAFKELGVRIALDDFGTGYSSLSYVNQLPLDKVKIDRSFVTGIGRDSSASFASAVITLCHTMGLECVAEGVETSAQHDALIAAGCEHAQGYLFSKPLALEDLLMWHALLEETASEGKRLNYIPWPHEEQAA